MSRFHNKTRVSPSIPHKLLKEGKFHLLPVYYLLTLSNLAQEGIKNSGSYKFADHIYQNTPQGKFGIGLLIDAIFLKLKSAQSFRYRYIYSKKEIYKFLELHKKLTRINLLAVPSGLAREMFETADEMKVFFW